MQRLVILAAAVLVGCGAAADSTAPPPPAYPAAAGSYHLSGSFNNLAATDAGFDGTLTIIQPSRDDSLLTGSANVTVRIASTTLLLTQFSQAAISQNGEIHFQLPPLNAASTWTFTGTLSGTTITGTHSLTNPTLAPSVGTFTAVKLAQ